MGNCFLHGNAGGESGGLYYTVVCQSNEPAKKEGRIWVKSSVPMTHFEFSPIWDGADIGNVSIQGSIGGLNPLPTNNVIEVFLTKRNGIYHRMKTTPQSCYQVQGAVGNWAPLDAYVCHSDTWVQFSWARVYLYNRGDSCNAITGGYQEISKSTGGTHEESSAMTSNAIHLKVVNYSQHASMIGRSTVKKVNLTNAKTIHISGNCVYTEDWVGVRVCNSQSLDDGGVASAYIRNSGTIDLTIDVSNLSGSYYIIAVARSAYKSRATEADIYQIWY